MWLRSGHRVSAGACLLGKLKAFVLKGHTLLLYSTITAAQPACCILCTQTVSVTSHVLHGAAGGIAAIHPKLEQKATMVWPPSSSDTFVDAGESPLLSAAPAVASLCMPHSLSPA